MRPFPRIHGACSADIQRPLPHLRQDEALAKHADWAEALQGRYTFTPENTEQILQQAVGAVFMQVLEDAGIYKRTPAGQSAFLRFTASV